MKKAFYLLFASAILTSLLTGCGSTSPTSSSGSSSSGSGSSSTGSGGSQSTATVPVSLTMTDDPPSGVSVLFFQVSLTAATLTPASSTSASGTPVSMITTPIQVDVTQLQALSAFLGTANVPAGSYSSLSLTFASPQLVILNTSDQAIASTCAVGSVCLLTPTLDNSATVNLSSAPFPVTVAANNPLGFLIDFRLNTIIQPDLSVNLGVANGVTLAQLPPSAPSQPPQFGSVTGTIVSLNASQTQLTIQTAWGKTFTIDTDSNTQLTDWPPCIAPGGLACLTAGDIVRVQVASVESDGDLLASSLQWVLSAASPQTVTGTIVGIIPAVASFTGAPWTIKLILHNNPTNSSSLPLGGEASVSLPYDQTTFSIDADGFTIPSGYIFASPNDLAVGQTVQVNIVPGSLTNPTGPSNPGNWGPPPQLSFTASNLQLEPSQLTGTVLEVGSSGFTLEYSILPCAFCSAIALELFSVQTTSQTTYQGFTPGDLSGVAVNDVVSVSGWLFPPSAVSANTNSTNSPTIVAQTVALHSGGWF